MTSESEKQREIIKSSDWEISWVSAATQYIEEIDEVATVLKSLSASFDIDEFKQKVFEDVDRRLLSSWTNRVEPLAEQIATTTIDAMVATVVSPFDSEEDRGIALELYKAQIEKLSDDFDLGKEGSERLARYTQRFFIKCISSFSGWSINSGLLALIDSAFERFVGRLMNNYYRQFEIDFDLQQLGLTYQEIAACSGPEDFKKMARARKVNSLMAKSFQKYVGWFSERDKKLVDAEKLVGFRAAEDFHLLRNVLIHEGGIVQQRHNEVANSKDFFEVGKRVQLGPKLLRKVIATYLSLGLSIWLMSAAKLFPERRGLLENVIQVALLRKRRYGTIRNLSALWFEDESSGQENMVNIWFADSKGGGERIEEVRSWNPEAPGFKLAKHLILAERDEAIQLAQEMIDSGELRLQEIYGWPILEDIREELKISKWE